MVKTHSTLFPAFSLPTMKISNCLQFLTAGSMKFSTFARVHAYKISSPVFYLLQVVDYFISSEINTKPKQTS